MTKGSTLGLTQVAIAVWVTGLSSSVAFGESTRSYSTADIDVVVRSEKGDKRTPYARLTAPQRERIDRVIDLLQMPPEKRPSASRRIETHPSLAWIKSVREDPKAAEIDCGFDATAGYALCWFGDDLLCGIVWGDLGGGFDIGCFD